MNNLYDVLKMLKVDYYFRYFATQRCFDKTLKKNSNNNKIISARKRGKIPDLSSACIAVGRFDSTS